ncbi:MAG: TIGR02186 family protein [bacterium]
MKSTRVIFQKGMTAFLMILGCLALSQNQASAALTIKANHDHIKIDFFYHGSTVSVSGISDPGTDLIIKITAPEEHQSLREKGKVGGILWMNVETLNVEHVPSLYFLGSTRKIEDILSGEEMEKHLIGYPALQRHVTLSPVSGEDEKTKWFNEFVKFKEASKLYSVSSGDVALTEKDGRQSYYTLMKWPYQASPGTYTVTVYEVKDKKVIDKAESHVLVEQAGLIASLSGMSKNNAAAYGALSILAAVGAGFGVGLVFKKSGGAH